MRTLLAAFILAGAAIVQGDILHLRDGSRHYGELVSQDERAIVFRVAGPGGRSSFIRTVPASQVARVERTGRRDLPPEDDAPTSQPQTQASEPDVEQMLREGFELLNDGDAVSALRAVQMAVQSAEAESLKRLEAQCRDAVGMPLDALLARLRVYAATRVERGRGFKLDNATGYERAALGRVLAVQAEELLGRKYQERSVEEWAARRNEYREVQPDARRLAADAARATALLVARMEFDPALRTNREEKARLTKLARNLAGLAGHVMSLRGYLELNPEDGWVDPAVAMLPSVATSQPTSAPRPAPESP